MRTTSHSVELVLARVKYGNTVFDSYSRILNLFEYRILPKLWLGGKRESYREMADKSKQIFEICLDMVKNGDHDSCRKAADLMQCMADEFDMVAEGLDRKATRLEHLKDDGIWVTTPEHGIGWLNHALPELRSMWS